MSVRHVKYLLIGGGLASCEAARAIRARDPRGDLMLIGQEINRPIVRLLPAQQGVPAIERAARQPVCGPRGLVCRK